MKDLDFDELDRAVNSLIGGPAPTSDVATTMPAAPSDAATVSTEEATETVSMPTPVATTPSEPQPLAARRSSGRFMDVVHPSSDMRVPFVPPRPSVHEASDIQPAVEPEPVSEPTLTPQEPAVTPVSSWPDPLDFHGFNNTESGQDETPAQTNQDDIKTQFDSASSETATDQLAPLESPFLADAKVEKRPLGAFTDSAATPATDAPQLSDEAPSANNDRPTETDIPLPAELQDNLLSIESNEDTASVATEVAPITPVFPPTTPVAAPDIQVSIAQQYVEQPSTGDKPAGSIFDVDSYHKPIAHPKKHKSGWMVALWIVLLLILGVGAGAAFYFYILPML